MLIHFNTTIDKLDSEDLQEIGALFSELLRASFCGLHMIIIDRDVCDWAKESLSLNDREVAQLDRLKAMYSQRGSLPALARCLLCIELGEAHLSEPEPHKYVIGHKCLLRGKYLEAARLLVEHIENDGDILTIILNAMRRKHAISAYDFELLHGGGADITACLRLEIPQRHIVVSLVDSDKVAPCDKASATKRNMDREAARQTYVGMVLETPCKEAENYVPLEIYKLYAQNICPEFSCFETLESLINSQVVSGKSDCLWLYFDLKKGIEARKLDSIENEQASLWLKNKYQLGHGGFSDIEIQGFGDAVLRQFLKCGKAVKEFIKFMDTTYWVDNFGDFFDLIYWYFASEKKCRSG